MKIAAVVFNSVLHDARVKKEADSLAKAGHEVAIFGVKDDRVSEQVYSTCGGVPIYLSDCQREFAFKLRFFLLFVLLLLIIALVPITFLVYQIMSHLNVILAFITACYVKLLTLVVVFMIALFLLYKWYVGWRWVNNKLAQVQEEGETADRSSLLSKIRGSISYVFGLGDTIAQLGRLAAFRSTLLADIKKYGPDVIHCHDVPTLPIGLALKKEMGSKIVFDSHEIFEEMANTSGSRKHMAIYYQKKASSKLDGMITVNPHIAKFLYEKYNYPKPVVVCNASLLPDSPPVNDGRLHKAANVHPSMKILLFQGGFAKYRGLEPLVKSASKLPKDWCIVFMGRGYYEDELKDLAATFDRNHRKIHFIPQVPQNELLHWTAGASLGIIPYENVCLNHWYCSPNKIWEYSAAGLPMLVSPFPFLQEMVEENGIGWTLTDPVTPESIAEKVAVLSDDDLEAAREACRTFAMNDNWTIYEKRLTDLYSELT